MTETPSEVQQYYEQANSEWESAFVAYRAAQSRLAYAGAFLALRAWSQMINPTSFARSLSRWLDYAVRIIRSFRARQRRLAQAYYQYGRALELGETYGHPLGGYSPTLSGYRGAFLDQLQDVALLDSNTPSDWDVEDGMDEIRDELRSILSGDTEDQDRREANYTSVDLDRAIQKFLDEWEDLADRPIQAQPIEWPDREADNADRAHRDYFRKEAEKLWKEEEEKAKVDEALEAEDDDKKNFKKKSAAELLQEASDRVGDRVAGRVMSATTNAADQVTNWAMDRDERVYGVARGTGPNPCALCAVAASRGFVYRSVSSAMTTSTGSGFRRYHENCQCYPIIRWSKNQAEPQTTIKWRHVYNAARAEGGNVFNAFRRRVHAENSSHVNARRRRYYERNKDRINARRRARQRRSRK